MKSRHQAKILSKRFRPVSHSAFTCTTFLCRVAMLLLLCFYPLSGLAAQTDLAAAHAQAGDAYLEEGRPFKAVAEYRQAITLGLEHPDVYRNLGVTLFNLGLVDDAISAMERGVAIAIDSDLYHLELGILYLIKEETDKAQASFFTALKINPGSSAAYYYLSELFLRKDEDGYAWLAAKMARRLGHSGTDLFAKLAARSDAPNIDPLQKTYPELFIRQIRVDSLEKAGEVMKRLEGGELFEDLAAEVSPEMNARHGGYAGSFTAGELHPEIAQALSNRMPLDSPLIVKTGETFQVVQLLIPFDFAHWQGLLGVPPEEESGADYLSPRRMKRLIKPESPAVKVLTPFRKKRQRASAEQLAPSSEIPEYPAEASDAP